MQGCGGQARPGKTRSVETRKLRNVLTFQGAAENGLFDIAESSGGKLEAYSLRPGGVLAEERGLLGAAASSFLPTVRVDHLAKAFIKVCLNGAEKQILENVDINEIGGLEAALQVNSFAL